MDFREGLEWIGVLEECDCCHDEYPMSWIIYNGIQFLCYACYYDGGVTQQSECRLDKAGVGGANPSTTTNPK